MLHTMLRMVPDLCGYAKWSAPAPAFWLASDQCREQYIHSPRRHNRPEWRGARCYFVGCFDIIIITTITCPGDGSVMCETTTSLYKILRFLAWDGILCDMGKHTHIELTSEERTELEKLIRTGNAPARTHTRARILLLSDRSQGQKRTDQEVADAVLCCKNTVRNVRRRFLSGGLQAALSDKGWPGASPKFTGEVEAKLVMLACSEPPEGAARWTLRLLADKMVELHYVDSMSHVTVGEILKKTKSSRGE
jgi:hypothetical protein